MLLGAVLSDILRIISGAAGDGAMCSGSVLEVDLRGAGVFVATDGDAGGSRVAAPGVSEGCAALVDACEGVRAIMVGTGVGFGAGRV
jgi:hypothetical protein